MKDFSAKLICGLPSGKVASRLIIILRRKVSLVSKSCPFRYKRLSLTWLTIRTQEVLEVGLKCNNGPIECYPSLDIVTITSNIY